MSETPTPESQPQATRSVSKRAFDAGGWGIPVITALCLMGLAFAHRGLLTLSPRTALDVPLSADVENWFFEPSDTSASLVILLVGWLLYRRRARLMRTAGSGRSAWLTALLFGAGAAVFFWAKRTDARELQAITVLFEILAAAHWFGGLAALRIVVVPAAFLIFAIPLPSPLLNTIVWKFQIWTADYAGFLLHLMGQSVFVAGDQLYRSDQAFQIIETCSGMRTIETLSMLAVLMVDLFGRRGWHAVVLLVLSPFVAFGINGFRALTLIFNPHSDIAAIHNLQGIVMLLAGVLILYFFDGGLERVFAQRPAPRPPKRTSSADAPVDLRRWGVAVAGVLVMMVLSAGVSRWQLPVLRPADPAPPMDVALEGWQGRDAKTDRIFLGQTGFLHILHREYRKPGEQIDLFVGTGARTSRYRSYYAPKTAYPGSGWIVDAHEFKQVDGRLVEELQVRRGTRRILIHHWREATLSLGAESVRAALGLDVSPLRRTDHPVVVRVSTRIRASQESAEMGRKRLAGFSGQIRTALQEISSPAGS